MKIFIYTLFTFLIFIVSCTEIDTTYPDQIEGYKPIYISKENLHKIYSDTPQPLINPGKIYVWNKYIFINEKSKGIHVIDNSNPTSPKKISFINIPGNIDIAVKSNVLYADNVSDLVALDISNINNIVLTKRIENLYSKRLQMFPDNITNIYFECVDTNQGYVINWVKTTLHKPKCKR